MTKIHIHLLTFFCVLTIIVSCDRPPCTNTNTVFDNYAPDTKEYKDELVKQLATVEHSKLTYWMDTYQVDSDSQYIHAYIQGDGLCAKIVLTVNGSEKGIEDILKKKGLGYSGAELEDLQFDIEQDRTATTFVFREITGIID